MTPESRQRFKELMNTLEYQRRSVRRLLIALALAGVLALLGVALTSCSTPPPSAASNRCTGIYSTIAAAAAAF